MQQNFEQARENMVKSQISPNKVTGKALLAALRRIPREKFLPESLKNRAYVDEDIHLDNGRYLPAPMFLARLLQEADVQTTDAVLDVGCGTGYATALLGCCARSVTGVEQDRRMAETGAALLKSLGIGSAGIVQQSDLHQGYAPTAPYDVILINGAVAEIPARIKSQLAEGGRLVTVLSRHGHMGTAVLVTRRGEGFSTQILFDAAMPFLAGFEEQKKFRF